MYSASSDVKAESFKSQGHNAMQFRLLILCANRGSFHLFENENCHYVQVCLEIRWINVLCAAGNSRSDADALRGTWKLELDGAAGAQPTTAVHFHSFQPW